MHALLKAPVDLLYFGGIGTYVKASDETHAEVGDRANDALRVDGARAARQGGRRRRQPRLHAARPHRVRAATGGAASTPTPSTTRPASTCSDHEVNIKILLGVAIAAGELTLKQRDALLAEMTDEVAALVLRDNYLQTRRSSSPRRSGSALLDQQARFMRALERAGRLDRALEFLPDDETLRRAQRARRRA